ncbi:sigma-70 family RNA polymerase sigma factor [Stackebrandtia nassauensis]|uniref:RNA polymerase, sigma-24 subunit, ECF subfamily n=1 Tax=Stackebrandtia nassauensis (strain DSM 44728 / CIP 108903 / NRRL B-16338 / NBRC 102104 / LLR-40K-21) TaxID=446470 RepID=D3Q810_STANL|nr:sigma-70 family RNA polymerase sigma factor [Stackebrandtia nassauensis]ADD40515.1 RNA polymerase, sigma-24 subunit, ECF subfamily [Stackebrandtia nassauensis DSM 44728]
MGSAQPPGEPRPSGDTGPVEQPSDAELIAATRSGDTTAYGQLYERHVHAARKLGRILARDAAEADDLTSETFAKVLATLRAGRGPDLAFRAYLLTTLRNTFYDRTRRDKKVEFTDDMTRHDPGEDFVDTAVAGQERRYAARAFHRLPERWQVVLWHTEVEGESAAEVAPLLGLSPNGVSALAYRARERLRQMYLQEHIADSPGATCRWTADRLGARVRGGLSNRDETKVDDHLEECTACKLLFVELAEVNSGMRGVLAPVILGLAAPAYLGGTALKSAVLAGWFGGVGVWVKSTFGWIWRPVNWARRGIQQMGGKGAAIAGGTAAVAGILALILVANNTTPPPEPPAQAQEPPVEDEQEQDEDEQDEPSDDAPDDQPSDEEKEKQKDEEDEPDPPARPTKFSVGTDLTSADLTAGGTGTLPITVTAPKQTTESGSAGPTTGRLAAAGPTTENLVTGFNPRLLTEPEDVMTLTLSFGEGISSPGGDAGDGWSCQPGEGELTCVRAELKPGQSTTAQIPLDVAPEVTGFHDIDVSVVSDNLKGTKTLRVPVAPVGMRTAYASHDATGVASAGNTLLTCVPKKHCRHAAADNHTSVMKSYAAEDHPGGLDGGNAVSGARLNIPAGAKVLWAGLHWTASGHHAMPDVKISTPGGGWQNVGAQRQFSGIERPVKQSVADITGMVWGSGEYYVAADKHALPKGIFKYAGWSITAVYQLPGAGPRETAVYEGLAQPRAEDTLSVSLPGAGESQLAYTVWDGDRTLAGDNFAINGTTVGDAGNFAHGVSESALEGADWNTFGVDVGTAEASHGDDAHATIFTGSDPLEIGVLALSTPPP